MGAKKTGRKKRSEYRKFKDFLEGLKKIEILSLQIRETLSVAMGIVKMKSESLAYKKFKSGGVVSGSSNDELVVEPGNICEPVLPMTEEQRKNVLTVDIFPDDVDYKCINPVRGYEDE